jgi:choline dehydrogenase-like flavoprotein
VIVDLEQAGDEPLEAELCVIGAGAAGLALVSALLDSDISVVLVESGREPPGEAESVLDAGEVGEPFNGLAGRARGLGGTMRLWPGQCLPLEPADLAPRPWVQDSGWPFAWEELARWYPPALEFLGLPPDVFEDDAFARFRLSRPELDPALLETRVSAFPSQQDRSRPLLPKLRASRRVRVVTGATAVRLVAHESGRQVAQVLLRSLTGAFGSVRAGHVVLCCGGIENPRLLLASGLGNEHDTVGRWFQDHVVARAARIEARDPVRLQTTFGVLFGGRVRRYPKLALAADARAAQQVLACAANVASEVPAEVGAALRVARAIRGRRLPERSDVGQALRGAPWLAVTAARRYGRGRSPARRSAPIGLLLVGEHAPNRDSRIVLAETCDPLGVPLPHVEWRLGELERRTLEVAGDVVAYEFVRLGLGETMLDPLLHDRDAWREAVFDCFHPAGATRMSLDPARGVVDPDCRVHGFDNLHVAGGSVFPTSGHANPTLTIVALALRLAARLRRELRP